MLARLGALFKKDVLLGFRNYYVAIVFFTAMLFVILINFVIPKEMSIEPQIYYTVAPEGKTVFTGIDQQLAQAKPLDSREDIVEKMRRNINSLGMVFKVKDQKPTVEFIMQGHESQEIKNILMLPFQSIGPNGRQEEMQIDTIRLKELAARTQQTFNIMLLPLFILFEPALLGLILLATLIFVEKEEGTIQAYAVTPGKLVEFLISKVLFILLLSMISVVVMMTFTIGIGKGFLITLLIVAVSSIFSSSLALFISSLFDNLSKAMMWLVLAGIIFSVPMMTYFIPGFAPLWIRIMPTYPLLFAIKEAMFPVGNTGVITSTIGLFAILSVVLFVLAVSSYRSNLVNE